jgi:hypothetical protein
VPLNTILKPALRGSKRSVTKLTEKEILHERTSKYCLTSQEQDTDGEVETKLFKVLLVLFANYFVFIRVRDLPHDAHPLVKTIYG